MLEEREIQFHAQTDWVGLDQIFLGYLGVSSTSDTSILGDVVLCIVCCEFGEVSVVVTLHLVVEHLRLPRACRWDEVLVHRREDNTKDFLEFSFQFHDVLHWVRGLLFGPLGLFGLFLLLLDRKLRWLFADPLHVLRHLIVEFHLLGETMCRYHVGRFARKCHGWLCKWTLA